MNIRKTSALLGLLGLISLNVWGGGFSDEIDNSDLGEKEDCSSPPGDPGAAGPGAPAPNTNVGNPINILSGSKYHREQIYRSGFEFPLEYSLTYNSHYIGYDGSAKVTQGRWVASYTQRLEFNGDDFANNRETTFSLYREDGSVIKFKGQRNTWLDGESNQVEDFGARLSSVDRYRHTGTLEFSRKINPSDNWPQYYANIIWGVIAYESFIYHRPDGYKEHFDVDGMLTKITAPSGLSHHIRREITEDESEFIDTPVVEDAEEEVVTSTRRLPVSGSGIPYVPGTWQLIGNNDSRMNLQSCQSNCSSGSGAIPNPRPSNFFSGPPSRDFRPIMNASVTTGSTSGSLSGFKSPTRRETNRIIPPHLVVSPQASITHRDFSGQEKITVTDDFGNFMEILLPVRQYRETTASYYDPNSDTLKSRRSLIRRSVSMCEGCATLIHTPGDQYYRFAYTEQNMLAEIYSPNSSAHGTPKKFIYGVKSSACNSSTKCKTLLTSITDENGHEFHWAYRGDTAAYRSPHFNMRAYKGWHGSELDEIDNYFEIDFSDDHKRTLMNEAGRKQVWAFSKNAGAGVKLTSIKTDANFIGTNCQADNIIYGYDAEERINNISVQGKYDLIYGYVGNTQKVNSIKQKPKGQLQTLETKYFWDPRFDRKLDRIEFYNENGTHYKTVEYDHYSNGRFKSREVIDLTTHTVPYSTNNRKSKTSVTYQYYGGNIVKQMVIDGPRDDVQDKTTVTFYSNGLVESVSNALGHKVDYQAYNYDGFPSRIVDTRGIQYEIVYNYRGQPTRLSYLDRIYSLDYYPNGLLHRVTYPDSKKTTYEYDSANNLTAVIDHNGSRLEYDRDPSWSYSEVSNSTMVFPAVNRVAGNDDLLKVVTRIKKGSSTVFEQEYYLDPLMRLYKAVTNEGRNTTEYNYDALSNLTKVDWNSDFVTSIEPDKFGRPTTKTNPDLGGEIYKQDADGNVIEVTDPRGLKTTYTRDGFGRVIRQVSPDTGTTDYYYDKAGNITKTIDANNVTTHYVYDAINRLIRIWYEGGAGNVIARDEVNYYYDKPPNSSSVNKINTGMLMVATAGDADQYYFYSEGTGLLNGILYLLGSNIPAKVMAYRYNNVDEVIEIRYPSGRKISYERREDGSYRIVSTLAGVQQVIASSVRTEPFDRRPRLLRGEADSRNLDYWGLDLDYKPKMKATLPRVGGSAGNITLAYYDLEYHDNGLLRSTDFGDNRSFEYDDGARVQQEVSSRYESINYDVANNIINRNHQIHGYEEFWHEPNSNRIQYIARAEGNTNDFEYTPKGQLLKNTLTQHQYTYDQGGLLRRHLKGSTLTTYEYNAFNERVSKSIGSQKTLFIYNGPNLIAELDGNGKVLKEYIYAENVMVAAYVLEDADNDGMDDEWERLAFGTTSRNGSGDYDSDGISDASEYAGAGNAIGSNSDLDNDGMLDAWEYEHFGHIAVTPEGDADGDEVSNVDEFNAGLNPVVNEAAWLVPVIRMVLQ